MTRSRALRAACLTALGLVAASGARAQSPQVEWRGLAFLDYAYTLSSDDPDPEGTNSFDYRRAYRTVTARLSDDPGEVFRASLGADYRDREGADAPGETSATVSGFVGAVTEAVRLGAEGDPLAPDDGVSVFAVVSVSEQTSPIARYDYAHDDVGTEAEDEHYVHAAFAYRPIPAVSVMPNVIATMPDGVDATVLARVTLDVRL